MKQFNIDEYLANPLRKVVTRNGRKVTRFLCTDAKGDYPIVALVETFSGNEMPISYTKDGEYRIGYKSDGDLFFATERKEGWINLYKDDRGYISTGSVYTSKEEAGTQVGRGDYLTTIKIEWEE